MHKHLIKALCAQFAGLLMTYSLSRNGILPALSLFWLALVQGCLAATISALLLSPRWWVFIHLAFLPAIVAALSLALPTWIYGAGFAALLLTYWTTFRTQVPLFLSNRITVHRLASWLPDTKPLSVLDLGSGTGSFAHNLALLRPDWSITGVESAPAPFAISRWRARHLSQPSFLRKDFWSHPLGAYDVIYAFLSPVPMSELWRKARKEMRPGSLFISNSFPVENVAAEAILKVDDSRQTRLFIYRIPSAKR